MRETAIDLDDIGAISALDKADLLGDTVVFDRQCREGLEVGRTAKLKVDPSRVANIIVMGMGGSGISGDVSRVLFEDELKVPLFVCRHYDLPAFVGPGTLAIAVSYSGNTEETLSGLGAALERGAQVLVISSGGRISELAVENNLTLVTIPAGLQPRAALGYLSIPLAVVLERLGFVGDVGPAIEEAIDLLGREAERYGPTVPLVENPAKQLAVAFFDMMPVVYGSEGITGLAAFRWRCQLNENAKVCGRWNMLPELDHNEICGWQELEELGRRAHLVFLRDKDEHLQIMKRFEATRELIAGHFDGIEEFTSAGESKAARLLSLIYLGDFASIYLALLNGIDPSPVERIEFLKKRLVE